MRVQCRGREVEDGRRMEGRGWRDEGGGRVEGRGLMEGNYHHHS